MKYCPNCGAQMNDADVFCAGCGKSTQVQQAPVYTQQSSADFNVSPKSRLCHLILLLTLGNIGVNDFYIGKGGKGALKLIFTILFFIFYCIGAAMMTSYYTAEEGAVMVLVGCCFFIPVGIINLVEFITTLTGSITDGDNRPIKNWVND